MNSVVAKPGVLENVNVDPPFEENGVIEREFEDEIEKSVASAVVAPEAPETEITQVIAVPSRSVAGAVHDMAEDTVGLP